VFQRQLFQDLGREPTPEEIAHEMGLKFEKVEHIIKISQETVSLESPVGEESTPNSEILWRTTKNLSRRRMQFTSFWKVISIAFWEFGAAGAEVFEDALRIGDRPDSHFGGGRQRVWCHSRANSANRSQSFAKIKEKRTVRKFA